MIPPHELYEDAYRRATAAGEHDKGARVVAARAVYEAGQRSVRVAPVRTAIARVLRGLAARVGPLLVLLLVACSFAEPQALEGHGDESSTGAGSDETGGAADGPPALTTAGSTLGSAGGSSGDVGPEETSDGSAIATDTTTTSAGSGSSTSGGDSSEGSTTGEDAGPYGDCHDGPNVPGNQLCPGSCVLSDDEGDELSACAPPCGPEPEHECPDGGSCLDDLVPQVGALVCVLDCETETCPAGMECAPMTYGGVTLQLCMWP